MGVPSGSFPNGALVTAGFAACGAGAHDHVVPELDELCAERVSNHACSENSNFHNEVLIR